jgi:hypothetical protein
VREEICPQKEGAYTEEEAKINRGERQKSTEERN